MEIRAAIPQIFRRAYPVLDPKTLMLPAISLLRFHEIDALPIAFVSSGEKRAVYGHSTLAKLLVMGPKGFESFLGQPCGKASEELASVSAESGIEELLQTFKKTRFGFAWVEDRDGVGGLVSLGDVLELYDTGGIRTDLRVGDVASPVFSMEGTVSLKRVLQAMFRRRYRRVFVAGKRAFISDRSIIGHIFSPSVLNAIARGSLNVLDTPIAEIGKTDARKVAARASIKGSAQALARQREGCLVCEDGVVTPWDLVMKPWEAGALRIRK